MFDKITAREINIVDSNGGIRASLGYDESSANTSLEMYDDAGLGRLQLSVDDRGHTTIRIMGRDGGNLIEVFAYGVPRHGIVISGLGGEPAIVQVVHPDGQSQFEALGK